MLNNCAIVLVRPQMGENIGAAARAMSNFGLSNLRIVAPRDGWPNEKARSMAANGLEIIESATVYATVAEVLADIHIAYATTGRMRDIDKKVLSAQDTAEQSVQLLNQGQKVALLFGPERTGLTNEDVNLVDALVSIPTDSKNPSLNLAQSVVVMAYELFKSHIGTATPPTASGREAANPPADGLLPATKEELQGFFTQLEVALDNSNHFREITKKPVMWQNLQNIFTRLPLNAQEVRTLRGVIRSLDRKNH